MEGRSLVDLVLEDVKVVCGCHSDNVLLGVPRRVKDLLAEVQAINADLVLATLPAHTHLEDDGKDRQQDEILKVYDKFKVSMKHKYYYQHYIIIINVPCEA